MNVIQRGERKKNGKKEDEAVAPLRVLRLGVTLGLGGGRLHEAGLIRDNTSSH